MDTMAVFPRILVPTDFSGGSQRAWDLAKRLGVTQGAELCLLHVLPATPVDVDAWLRVEERKAELRAIDAEHQLAILRDDQIADDEPPPGPVFRGPLTGDVLRDFSVAGRAWAAMLEKWAADGRSLGCKVHTELRIGVASSEIVAAAKDYEADLVLMATHGHGNVHRLIIGSVADRVIRMAPCAVLTLKAA